MSHFGDLLPKGDMGRSGRFYSTRPFVMIDPADAFWPMVAIPSHTPGRLKTSG
jgi:hypothetical protein